METYILKIGGSSVTEKYNNVREAKKAVIRRIAQEIKKAKSEKEFRLLVVHGAGPFGHKLVVDYGIKDGIKTEKDVEGFVRTHNSMEDLNKIFMDIFREEGLLGFPMQPSACIIQDLKKLMEFETKIIKKLLEISKDIIPMLYGDMVIDRKLGASVVSGDVIIPYLAKKLGADRVLMGTDVDGIFTADPKMDKSAKLIEKIDEKNFDEVLKHIGEVSTVDVTGGMKGKLMKLRENMEGINSVIFNITKENNTYKILTGEKIRCTEMKL